MNIGRYKVGDAVVFRGKRKQYKYMNLGDIGHIIRLTRFGAVVMFAPTESWNGIAFIRYPEIRKRLAIDEFFEDVLG